LIQSLKARKIPHFGKNSFAQKGKIISDEISIDKLSKIPLIIFAILLNRRSEFHDFNSFLFPSVDHSFIL